jgi:subfamily B ATP-binding cassette protein MsbA
MPTPATSLPQPVAEADGGAPGGRVRPPRKARFDTTDLWETLDFFKRLAQYLKPYRARFLWGQAAGVGFAVLNGMLPLLTQIVLSHTVPGSVHGAHPPAQAAKAGLFAHVTGFFDHLADGRWGIFIVCSCIPGVMILRGLCDYFDSYISAWVSLKVLGDMRRKAFSHIASQSLNFFLENRSGNLISRVANDTRIAQMALGLIGADLIKQPFCVLVGVSTLLHLDARFTVIALVLFPACIVPVAVYGKRIRKSGRMEEEQAGLMTVILQETFAGMRVIKSFAREDYQVQQFDDANNAQFLNAIRVRKATEIVSPMVEVVAAIGVGLALLYVNYRGMSLSTFVSLVMGLFLLYNPIKQISRMHMQIQKCRAATGDIFALLELQPTILDAPDATPLEHCAGEISFTQVYFQYPRANTYALNNLNLRVRRGQTVALVGASGAGKSTVLSLLQRFYDPEQGSICIDGVDLRKLTQRSVREHIGVVTQDTFLFHDTIFNNIRYGRLDAPAKEVYAAAAQAYVHDFINTLPEGYETVVGDKGCRLSGGQQQRLAIARALLKNAPILLLDEATSALDSESERMIQIALETLSAGKTVIAIAHRLSTILKADRIVVMEGGEVVESGTHARLYAMNGRYRRLYDLQFDHQERAQEMADAAAPAAAIAGLA